MAYMSSFSAFVFVVLATLLGAHGSTPMWKIGLEKSHNKYPLPSLPFTFEAMEPYLGKETLKMHYDIVLKDHARNLNNLLKEWKSTGNTLAMSSLAKIWRNERTIPVEFRDDFYRYGGGYLNHVLYFATMSPPGTNSGRMISNNFAQVVNRSFPSITKMKKEMFKLANETVFGSGWVFLVRDAGSNSLTLMTTTNEMSPLTIRDTAPILALDMWEHAYLIKHGFSKKGYFDNWWQTIDWSKVEEIYNYWRQAERTDENSSLPFVANN